MRVVVVAVLSVMPPQCPRSFIAPNAVYYIATQGEGGNGYLTKITATT